MYEQLINLLDKQKVLNFSRSIGSEKYVKSFDAWQHLLVMLYAVIKRLNSLREISASIYPEASAFAICKGRYSGIAEYFVRLL